MSATFHGVVKSQSGDIRNIVGDGGFDLFESGRIDGPTVGVAHLEAVVSRAGCGWR